MKAIAELVGEIFLIFIATRVFLIGARLVPQGLIRIWTAYGLLVAAAGLMALNHRIVGRPITLDNVLTFGVAFTLWLYVDLSREARRPKGADISN